ncbi:Bms1-type G domain-containing protein [Haematococcus lacustris]|uniref:Bms1-type G domain-containing protein n=1 Tax=Haematococcus lacustris TaxID=44745 RepID=A0A699YPA4_HAELA|nr:Bms1-type G domain-containing protein [Haematococcus lacustris]
MSGKGHRVKKAGRKVEKRKTAEQKKKGVLEDAQARKQNPRAFAFQSANVAKGQKARTAEREQRRLHAPMLERVGEEAPPLVVLVQGPPQVLKQWARARSSAAWSSTSRVRMYPKFSVSSPW